ncbi:hypothetical protein XCV3832 [Xanthomonas euvesicatoria pv. vesicatoria str. 85-10]|uniref:Uncharacterized protein n=1 Tax=Xanthomonas euvesicatoria pv. vesicatoria (strain 85-10) TaxID=316273 RepID=Q3BNV0_XANE5|nr:hypothetical protein XCV3832 [Xanthomonas euvesicatoria pv. vesicatoria str. 85-10]
MLRGLGWLTRSGGCQVAADGALGTGVYERGTCRFRARPRPHGGERNRLAVCRGSSQRTASAAALRWRRWSLLRATAAIQLSHRNR